VAHRYEIVTAARAGSERVQQFTAESALAPGDVLRLGGRDLLVYEVEDSRVLARPARYRVRLRHSDTHEELGAFRRFRTDAPRTGHTFTTLENGRPASWQVVEERLAVDDDGEPYLDLVAERDYGEFDDLPPHELEHAVAREDDVLPEEAATALARAEAAGLAVELVALDPGEAPDWEAAESYVDALVLEEIEDDLLEMCGVNPNRDPREEWLATVKERLVSDLRKLRADIEGDHAQILEWSFRDGRIFASVGSDEDESDPASGHGWMCRLVDASALSAAGFARVRRAEL
jgi:hypothetical protein